MIEIHQMFFSGLRTIFRFIVLQTLLQIYKNQKKL